MAQLALDQTLQVDGDGVGPGQLAVLLPPSLHHQRHVEAEEKSDGNSCALIPTPSGGEKGDFTNAGPVSPPYEFLHDYLLLWVETGAVDAGDY